jgi:hypothetical protein
MGEVQQIGEFVLSEKLSQVPLEHFYGVNPRGRWVWLQSLCVRVLKNLGCIAVLNRIDTVKHTIDCQKILDRVWEQKQGVHSFFRTGSPCAVLMGPDEFRECCLDSHQPVGVFDFPVRFRGEYGGRPTVFGLKIIVVPWISGVVILPPGYEPTEHEETE